MLALILYMILLLFAGLHKPRLTIASLFFKILLRWSGIRVESTLPKETFLTKKRVLIVSNHVSYLDVLILSSLQPCVFLAKSEVSNWPVFGWVARALGCVFVKRDSLMGRACALRTCLLHLGHSNLAIFPEGTTTASAHPHAANWSKGHAWLARRAALDAVLCIGLHFENQPQRAWTDDQSLIPHLFKTLGEKTIRVKVSGSWSYIKPHLNSTALANSTWLNVCEAVRHVYSG